MRNKREELLEWFRQAGIAAPNVQRETTRIGFKTITCHRLKVDEFPEIRPEIWRQTRSASRDGPYRLDEKDAFRLRDGHLHAMDKN